MKREVVKNAMRAYQYAVARSDAVGKKQALMRCLEIPDMLQAEMIPATIMKVPKEVLWKHTFDRPRDFQTANMMAETEALREAHAFAGNYGEPTEKEVQHVRACVSRLLLLQLMLEAVRGVNSFNPRNYRLVSETHPHPQAYLASKHAFVLMLPERFNINIIQEPSCSVTRDSLGQVLEELSHIFEARY